MRSATILLEAAVVHQKLGQYHDALECVRRAEGTMAALGREGGDPLALMIEAAVRKRQGDVKIACEKTKAAIAAPSSLRHGLAISLRRWTPFAVGFPIAFAV